MLDEIEKVQCKKLLELLSISDVVSLKDTVTNRLIRVQDREEAITAILDYSESVIELLNRKKVGRDLVFQYLHNEHQRVDPKGDKKYLVTCAACYMETLKGDTNNHNPQINEVNRQCLTPPSNLNSQEHINTTSDTDRQISSEFVNWFYPMLNSLHGPPFTCGVPWSSDHFWHDCRLRCDIPPKQSNKGPQIETVDGAYETHRRLSSLVTDNHLIFNVNDTSSGHRGRINPHGLAKVIACGTIHKSSSDVQSQPCAMFEQLFGLIRDPMDGNRWKIKFTDLRLSMSVGGDYVPSLSDATLLQIEQD